MLVVAHSIMSRMAIRRSPPVSVLQSGSLAQTIGAKYSLSFTMARYSSSVGHWMLSRQSNSRPWPRWRIRSSSSMTFRWVVTKLDNVTNRSIWSGGEGLVFVASQHDVHLQSSRTDPSWKVHRMQGNIHSSLCWLSEVLHIFCVQLLPREWAEHGYITSYGTYLAVLSGVLSYLQYRQRWNIASPSQHKKQKSTSEERNIQKTCVMK